MRNVKQYHIVLINVKHLLIIHLLILLTVKNADWEDVRIVKSVEIVESVNKYVKQMIVRDARKIVVHHVLNVKDVQFVRKHV